MNESRTAYRLRERDNDLKALLLDARGSLDARTLNRLDAGITALLEQNREMEARLDRVETEHDALLAAIDQQGIVYDASGRVIRANHATISQCGPDLVGMEMQEIITHLSIRHPDGRPVELEDLPGYRALRGEAVTGERLDITDRSGRHVRVLSSATPVTVGGVPSGAVVVWQDVTEQEETNTLLEGMFESLGDIVGIQLPDHTILRYNKACYEMLGMTPDEVDGKKCYELIGRDRPCEVCATAQAIESRQTESIEKHVPELGRHLACTSSPILNDQGEVVLIIEQLHDITDRVLAMEALRESEATARALLNAPTDAISVVDPDGRVIDVNETVTRLLGRSRDEIVGRSVYEIFPPEIAREQMGHLAGILESGAPARFEERAGETWYDTVIYPIRDETGKVVRLATIARDITERRQIQERLRESEEQFRRIAQRSYDMIYTCYYDRGITFISPAVMRILGYTPDELIGARCRDYVIPVCYERFEEGRKRVARGEPIEGLVVEFRRKDGTAAIVELSESPIVEDGKVVGVQAAGRDITDRKHGEDLRQQAFEQIERNIEQFAVLGDHVRQPLQVILGMADLFGEEKPTEVIRDQVERINGYIKELDRGWIESRQIREFLRRHELP
jgi:PAS domain S-box-containing protein